MKYCKTCNYWREYDDYWFSYIPECMAKIKNLKMGVCNSPKNSLAVCSVKKGGLTLHETGWDGCEEIITEETYGCVNHGSTES